jgi:WD40 repeat protein
MTVKIWDVTTQACQHTFEHHTDKVRTQITYVNLSKFFSKNEKPDLVVNNFIISLFYNFQVQSVVWHYDEAWLLASGAFDQTVALLDCRTGMPSFRPTV